MSAATPALVGTGVALRSVVDTATLILRSESGEVVTCTTLAVDGAHLVTDLLALPENFVGSLEARADSSSPFFLSVARFEVTERAGVQLPSVPARRTR